MSPQPSSSGRSDSNAAKKGAYHWWLQRLTAIALVPLSIWLAFTFAMLDSASHAAVIEWLQAPGATVFLVLFIAITLYHTQLGLQVIIEDYVGGRLRAVSIIVMNLLCILLAAIGIVTLLTISLQA